MLHLLPGFQRKLCLSCTQAVWRIFFYAPFTQTGNSGRATVGPAVSGLSSAWWSREGKFSSSTSGTKSFTSRGTCDWPDQAKLEQKGDANCRSMSSKWHHHSVIKERSLWSRQWKEAREAEVSRVVEKHITSSWNHKSHLDQKMLMQMHRRTM